MLVVQHCNKKKNARTHFLIAIAQITKSTDFHHTPNNNIAVLLIGKNRKKNNTYVSRGPSLSSYKLLVGVSNHLIKIIRTDTTLYLCQVRNYFGIMNCLN